MAWDTRGWGDSPAVVDCVFQANTSDTDGGAILVQASISGDSPRDEWWDCTWISDFRASLLLNCVFEGNEAPDGGGAIWSSDAYGFGIGVVGCVFRENSADRGGAVYHVWDHGSLYCGCTFYDNVASSGGAGYFRHDPSIYYSTFCFNSAASGAALAVAQDYVPDGVVIGSVFAFNESGPVIDCGLGDVILQRCLAYGNAGGEYLCPNGLDNIVADPLFCDPAGRDFTLCSNSPCLPQNNYLGEQLGAHGQGCGDCSSAAERQTWSGVKALFR